MSHPSQQMLLLLLLATVLKIASRSSTRSKWPMRKLTKRVPKMPTGVDSQKSTSRLRAVSWTRTTVVWKWSRNACCSISLYAAFAKTLRGLSCAWLVRRGLARRRLGTPLPPRFTENSTDSASVVFAMRPKFGGIGARTLGPCLGRSCKRLRAQAQEGQ